MAIRKLDPSTWQTYFDRLSKNLPGKLAEIEIAALDIGDQIQAEWVPLLGITYDRKDDLLEVLVEGLDHLIHHPREIHVDEGPAGLVSMNVVDADNVQQIIKLREPLMLPYEGDS